MGQGRAKNVQTWGCNYLSGCDSCVLSQFCVILFHFLQHWLIHRIEEQVGSSTFSSQHLVPNLGRDRTEQTGMSLEDLTLAANVHRPAAPKVLVRVQQQEALHQGHINPCLAGLLPNGGQTIHGMSPVKNGPIFKIYWELIQKKQREKNKSIFGRKMIPPPPHDKGSGGFFEIQVLPMT